MAKAILRESGIESAAVLSISTYVEGQAIADADRLMIEAYEEGGRSVVMNVGREELLTILESHQVGTLEVSDHGYRTFIDE